MYVSRDLSFPGMTDDKILSDEVLATPILVNGHDTVNYCAYLQKVMKLSQLDEMMHRTFPGIGVLQVKAMKMYRLCFKRGGGLYPWHQDGSGVTFVLTIYATILYDIARLNFELFEYVHILALDGPTSPLHPQILPASIINLEALKVQLVIATHSVDSLFASSTRPFPELQVVPLSDNSPFARRQLNDDVLASLGLPAHAISSALPACPMKTSTLASLSAFNRLLYVKGKSDVDMLRVFMEVVDEHRAAAFFSKVVIEFVSKRESVAVAEGIAGGKEQEVVTSDRLAVAVLVGRGYWPKFLVKFEAEKFEKLAEKSSYLVSDAKRLLKSLGLKNVQAWRAIVVAVGKDKLSNHLKDLVERLFQWAAVFREYLALCSSERPTSVTKQLFYASSSSESFKREIDAPYTDDGLGDGQ
ncbi:hypothetical protein BC832DRAFT_542953 [Gaertneriomyces semiglobifer]|nr:hypothetical protein BC832DRAFT_542953 [Gaertneriomyces semiglobifer]